jgi:hypothetical protein
MACGRSKKETFEQHWLHRGFPWTGPPEFLHKIQESHLRLGTNEDLLAGRVTHTLKCSHVDGDGCVEEFAKLG